jgi:serine/threonine-protein kinase
VSGRRAKSQEPDLIGHPHGNFAFTRVIGEGAMGIVYLAEHQWIGRRKAVKVLRQEMAQINSHVRRFFQEAVAASACQHEHIIDIEDCGEFTVDGLKHHYIDMEYLEGVDVDQACAPTGRFEDIDRAVKVIGYAADALAVAHEHGIVHRDVTPQNVFLARRGTRSDYVKVLDFGVARLTGDLSTGVITRTGTIFGTPAYRSPEQAKGLHPDGRSDVWSLAVLLYRMLAGSTPWWDLSPTMLAMKIMQEPAPDLRELRPDVPEGVVRAIREAMRKRVEDRPTMLAFKDLLLSGDAAPRAILPELSISAPSFRHSGPTVADAPTMIIASVPSELPMPPPVSTREESAPIEPMPTSHTAPTSAQRPRGYKK